MTLLSGVLPLCPDGEAKSGIVLGLVEVVLAGGE